ncbi:UNVERIFIED_CONTAM: hypothetical protein FKN15_014669 [Acipenser sinensis]
MIAVAIISNLVSQCTELDSNQEEADTIILHVITAAEAGADIIVVCSPDTDVLVLLLHHCPSIKAKEIYLMTGRQGKQAKLTRFIPIHTIYGSLTRAQHNILLPVYGITGCDTVNALLGHGKKKAFWIMMKDADTFQAMTTLGDTTKQGDGEKAAATQFVSCLYGESTFCGSLNDFRGEKAEKGNAVKKLPPTDDSFMLHLLQCLYQVLIWKHADIGMLDVPSPIHFEKEVDGQLRPKLVSQ